MPAVIRASAFNFDGRPPRWPQSSEGLCSGEMPELAEAEWYRKQWDPGRGDR